MKRLLVISSVGLALFLLLSGSGCQADRAGRIVFTGPHEGRNLHAIYSMKPDGSDRVRLTHWLPSGMLQYHNIWSADGRTLAYIDDSDNITQRYWLSVVDGNGQNRRRLLDITDLKMDTGGMAISPDGKTIVLSLDSTRVNTVETPQAGTVHVEVTTNYDLDLFTVDVKTGKLNRLTDSPGVMEKSPAYSPDGKQIGFVAQIDTEEIKGVTSDVFVMNADGSKRRHLVLHTDGEFIFEELRWSPDSSKIAYFLYNNYVNDDEQYTDIFVINVKTGTLTNLTNSPYVSESDPSWSPDSRKIAYYSGNVTEGFHTIVMDIASGNVTRLEQRTSSWTPDGKGLIFVNPLNVFELMVVEADGKNPRSLAVSKDISISNPFWLPD